MGFKSMKRFWLGETMVHGLSGLSDAAVAYWKSGTRQNREDFIFAASKEGKAVRPAGAGEGGGW